MQSSTPTPASVIAAIALPQGAAAATNQPPSYPTSAPGPQGAATNQQPLYRHSAPTPGSGSQGAATNQPPLYQHSAPVMGPQGAATNQQPLYRHSAHTTVPASTRGLLPPSTLPYPPPFTSTYHHPPFSPPRLSHPPHLKAAVSPGFAPHNGHDQDPKDKVPDDAFFTLKDRKVRISDRGSVYALCCSWLRNGYPEQCRPQFGDTLKSLPRPLPMPDATSPKRKESDDETESDEDGRALENSSTEELLHWHIKRAKRVRERLREERLQRIKRYKGRLSLLLPLPVEQCNGP